MAPPAPQEQQFRPLAGRPPFATDEPDSVYDLPAHPRPPPRQKPVDPNARTSAYNAYDTYLDDKEDAGNRDSGAAFGVGMGLLGEVSDSDSDDDDEVLPPRKPAAAAPSSSAPGTPKGKNQALFEALAGGPPAVPTPQRQESDPFQDSPRSQPRSADPRRPAQLTIPPTAAASNHAQPARSPQFPPSPSQIRQQALPSSPSIHDPPSPADIPSRMAAASPMPAPRPQRPAPAFMLAPPGSPAPPSYSSAPSTPITAHGAQFIPVPMPTTPLQLPNSTPITPFFAAPPTPLTDDDEKSAPKVQFAKGIIRGEKEDVFVERTRANGRQGSDDSHMSEDSQAGLRQARPRKKGADGDDFWRRFSMVAHQVQGEARGQKSSMSAWLSKTDSRNRSYSRWVALIGAFLLLCIAGGIAAGIYLNSGKGNGHAAPEAIGGKAEESDVAGTTTSTVAVGGVHSTSSGMHAQKVITENGSIVAAPTARRRSVWEENEGLGLVPTATPTPTPNADAVAKQILGVGARHEHARERRSKLNRIIH